MQETKTRTPAEEVPSSRPPWIRAVAIAAAVALLGGVLYATWQAAAGNDDPEPDPIGLGEPEPDFSLTDEEAIATFQRLSSSLRAAVAQRDQTLVASVATSGGNTSERLRQEIRRLKDDQVIDRTTVETLRSEVIVSNSTSIEIREVIRLRPCFETESGEDVTQADAVVEQVGIWTLAIENDRWLIDDTQLEDDRVIDGSEARCRD